MHRRTTMYTETSNIKHMPAFREVQREQGISFRYNIDRRGYLMQSPNRTDYVGYWQTGRRPKFNDNDLVEIKLQLVMTNGLSPAPVLLKRLILDDAHQNEFSPVTEHIKMERPR